MADQINSLLDKIYVYIMRDITYVLGGGLILAACQYACGGNLSTLKDAVDYLSQSAIKLSIFIVFSYVIGFLVEEGAMFVKLMKMDPGIPDPYKSRMILMAEINERYGIDAIRRFERIVYLKHFGAAIGSASLLSFLISLVPLIKHHTFVNFSITVVLAFFTVISIKENRQKLKKQEDALEYFAKNMNCEV